MLRDPTSKVREGGLEPTAQRLTAIFRPSTAVSIRLQRIGSMEGASPGVQSRPCKSGGQRPQLLPSLYPAVQAVNHRLVLGSSAEPPSASESPCCERVAKFGEPSQFRRLNPANFAPHSRSAKS